MHPLPEEWDLRDAPGLRPGQAIGLFELGDMHNFVYVLADWESGACAIVDPNRDSQALFQALEKHGLKPTHLLLTHSHHDHVGGVRAVLDRFPDIVLYVHPLELHRLGPAHLGQHATLALTEGQNLLVGTLKLQVLHTPGHTAGECCFLLQAAPGLDRPALLTGDTVFVGNVGRTDLGTGSDAELFSSIQRIKALPPRTLIFPGHHYAPPCISSIERECASNPAFSCKTVEELTALP